MLVFTVLNTATNPTSGEKGNHYFGLAIGFVIMAGAKDIGHVSGCSLNPAVSFGIAMGSIIFGSAPAVGTAILNCFLYCLAEGLGCVLAAVIFHIVRSANIKKRDNAKTLIESIASKCVAEFTGTFYLILTVCLVCNALAAPALPSAPALGVVGIASSLMVMIYSLGAVSGANFNPAVTLGLGMRGELPWGDAAAYWASQLAGGVFAAGMAAAIEAGNSARGYNIALVASTQSIDGITGIAGKGTWGQIILAEWFYTFLLVLVVLNTAAVNMPNSYFGLAIGMCVTVGGIAVGGITGGCFNPAVSFALSIGGLFAKGDGAKTAAAQFAFLGYWAAQLLGAATAAGVTAAVRGSAGQEKDAGSGDEDQELLPQ
jgi:glycerol uptake facilitator-like aquaporin